MFFQCEHCGLRFEREPGYFLGSIYINYGLTALLVTIFYFALFSGGWTSPRQALWIVAGFALVFPIWFFRYARSLWLGFDHFWDPAGEENDAAR
jgi:heme A synthase